MVQQKLKKNDSIKKLRPYLLLSLNLLKRLRRFYPPFEKIA